MLTLIARAISVSIVISLFLSASVTARLSTSGRDLIYNGQRVFLSGVNIAWNSYGYDFGNGAYASNSKATLESWLTSIANSGGSSVRIWLHIEGDNTPAYDANGFVTGPDRTGTMIYDMKSFLDFAQSKNILVVFVLWNGAVLRNPNTINLFWDEGKLQSYIDNALKPMASALAGHPALVWEIINEPEGSVFNNQVDSNPCFDTQLLVNTGAGWTGLYLPMKNVLKFITWQVDAIKQVDSGAMVTVGAWNQHAQTDAFGQSRNYYKDECLLAAGSRALGKLDFFQVHTYGPYGSQDPFKVNAGAYQLNKPLIIGEFASSCSDGNSIESLYQYSYDNGYQGAWAWQYNAGGGCADTQGTQNAGMLQLKGKNGAGGLVNFPVN